MKEKQSGSVLHLEVLFVLVYLSKNLVFLGEIRNNPRNQRVKSADQTDR